jgi:hypothetical protein
VGWRAGEDDFAKAMERKARKVRSKITVVRESLKIFTLFMGCSFERLTDINISITPIKLYRRGVYRPTQLGWFCGSWGVVFTHSGAGYFKSRLGLMNEQATTCPYSLN